MANMIFFGLYHNMKHTSASQYSCRASITCSEKILFKFEKNYKAESLIQERKKIVSQKFEFESELNLLQLNSGE